MAEVKTVKMGKLLKDKHLQVFLFNVGQGDHIMLKFPNHEYGIIDFFYDASQNIIEPPALSYFKALEATLRKEQINILTKQLQRIPTNQELDEATSEELRKKIIISFFCISHTDKDHTKGIGSAIEWFYSKGILIKEFWFPAAQDEKQIKDYVLNKVPQFVRSKAYPLMTKNKVFEENFSTFYNYYDKWKKRKFNSTQYHKRNDIGVGSYLADIKQLKKPCSRVNCRAINLGPLLTDVNEQYESPLIAETVRKLLDPESKPLQAIDKNEISHILLIRYGCSNLLFGGDTHRETWEKCLELYHNPHFPYLDDYGEIDSHFIKVSHHGSEHSSSAKIWETLLDNEREANLGISAGNHTGYKHPAHTTIAQIKGRKSNALICSTNICQFRINENKLDSEHHIWYDDYIQASTNSPSLKMSSSTSVDDTDTREQDQQMGLFAYIFEIPYTQKNRIKITMALTKTNRTTQCFHAASCNKKFSSCQKI